LYFENCKPTLNSSRKTDSKIHAKLSFSGVRQFFADRIPAGNTVGFAPAFA